MNEYTPFYSRKFSTNLQHYAAMRQPIKRRVERILQAPYHNTETLADIDVQKKIRVKKPGFCQKPGFSTPNDDLRFYRSWNPLGRSD